MKQGHIYGGRRLFVVLAGVALALVIYTGVKSMTVPVDPGPVMDGAEYASLLRNYAGLPSATKLILRQFEASNQWRVVEEGGAITAERKLEKLNNNTTFRKAAITFGPHTRYSWWQKIDLDKMTTIALNGTPVPIKIWEQRDHDQRYASVVFIPMQFNGNQEENKIVVRIYEESANKSRTGTLELAKIMVEELGQILKNSDEIAEHGYVSSITPEKSVQRIPGEGTIEITPTTQRGIYQVSGYMNAGKPGYITIRTINTRNGHEIAEDVKFRTKQYVGWSSQSETKFHFESEMVLGSETDKSETVELRFEVIFHPIEEFVLLKKNAIVETWIR